MLLITAIYGMTILIMYRFTVYGSKCKDVSGLCRSLLECDCVVELNVWFSRLCMCDLLKYIYVIYWNVCVV